MKASTSEIACGLFGVRVFELPFSIWLSLAVMLQRYCAERFGRAVQKFMKHKLVETQIRAKVHGKMTMHVFGLEFGVLSLKNPQLHQDFLLLLWPFCFSQGRQREAMP